VYHPSRWPTALSAALIAGACAPAPPEPDPLPPLLFAATRPYHVGEEIYLIDVETGEERRLTFSGEGRNSNIPNWSPDHSQIAFASDREVEGRPSIYVMDADGSDQRRLTPVGAGDFMPIWSPDGKQILFRSSRTDDYEVWVMDADGSNQRNLTQSEGGDGPAQWTLDGDSIVFTSNRTAQGGEVYIMGRDGGPPRLVGPGWGTCFHQADKHHPEPHVCFMDIARGMAEGTRCGGIMSMDGTILESHCGDDAGDGDTPEPGFLSIEEGLESPACRSPDGRWIAFHALPEGSATYPIRLETSDELEVFVARADGSELRRLTFNDSYEGHCAW
jgi:Tol biopolymer transport system component